MIVSTQSPRPYCVAVASDRPAADRLLTPTERLTCAAIPDSRRRSDWRAGRIAAKRAAARLAGARAPERFELIPGPGRAPTVVVRGDDGATLPASLTLSLAHRDGRAAAVAARPGVRIGVDVERLGAIPVAHERYFLTPAERLGASTRDAAELWTLKEAAWKALGCDPSMPFSAIELRFDGRGALRALQLQGATLPARANIRHPWRGYVVAVVHSPANDR